MERIVSINYKEIDFEVYCDHQKAEPAENGTGNQFPVVIDIEKIIHSGNDLFALFSIDQIEEIERLVLKEVEL